MNLWLRYDNDEMYDRFYPINLEKYGRSFVQYERRAFLIKRSYYNDTEHILELPEFMKITTLLSKGFSI